MFTQLQPNSVNTRPLLIVRSLGERRIVTMVPAESLEPGSEAAQAAKLRDYFPAELFEIDTTQVEYARQGLSRVA